jgi:hypothetical protein
MTGGTSGITQGSGGEAGEGAAGTAPSDCVGPEVSIPKRLVRLSFNQIANAITSLFDAATTSEATAMLGIPGPLARTFPPLSGGTEGTIITDTQWALGDTIAQGVAKHVFEDFETVTQCGASPTSDCGRTFVSGLADRAFRRPTTEAEQGRLLAVFDGVLADGGTVQDAVRYGIYAIFESPLFLYRTEFGTDANSAGPLTATELADELSFFLTDAPPDSELADAARSNALSTPDQVGAQATRLLAAPFARANLEAAMSSYFALPRAATVIIDPATIPSFTLDEGARGSVYREAELFLRDTLWNGPLSGLVTSQRAYVNSVNAPIYGLDPAGRTTDTFEPVQLADGRAGLLTLSAFLMSTARPDGASVVSRALVLNRTLLCQVNPDAPRDDPTVMETIAATANLSQKEQADYRANTPRCAGCHGNFDGLGLALERFDSIGRARTTDLQGRTIDDAWITATLPDVAGTAEVRGASEMANAVVTSGALQACVTKNFIEFALADTSRGGAAIDSCAVAEVVERFEAGDRSFTSLLREIAASKMFSTRAAPSEGGN